MPGSGSLVQTGAVGVDHGVRLALAEDAARLVDEHVNGAPVEVDADPRRPVLHGAFVRKDAALYVQRARRRDRKVMTFDHNSE